MVRLFNTYGPGEYYSPYRSVNCRFLYCALAGLPWTVFRGHYRTSTYLADTVRTLANIAERFKAGEVYNIGGEAHHSIDQGVEDDQTSKFFDLAPQCLLWKYGSKGMQDIMPTVVALPPGLGFIVALNSNR